MGDNNMKDNNLFFVAENENGIVKIFTDNYADEMEAIEDWHTLILWMAHKLRVVQQPEYTIEDLDKHIRFGWNGVPKILFKKEAIFDLPPRPIAVVMNILNITGKRLSRYINNANNYGGNKIWLDFKESKMEYLFPEELGPYPIEENEER